jgi:tRNA-specific 2-thiouridylase
MKKVYVGVSGGVDSATSAALLQSQGFDVVGVFIKIWQPEFIECTWREDRLDAIRVCASLGIPFREIDLSDAYRSEVVESMIADYRRGVTPNPDVLCNERIKFGAFLQWALQSGADYVATGHYAQTRQSSQGAQLVRGIDIAKDQSYFLYRMSQKDVARVMFPIGGMHKTEVRVAARHFNLPVSEKPDSQGLCFVGEVSMRDFLRRYIEVAPGSVVDATGKTIGSHEGAALYTVGQRHGFSFTNNTTGEPHYVTAIDTLHNLITVSSVRSDAASEKVSLRAVHWIGGTPAFPLRCSVQARYHEPAVEVVLDSTPEVVCTFDAPHIASPGQSLVVYKGDECLGGGIIV